MLPDKDVRPRWEVCRKFVLCLAWGGGSGTYASLSEDGVKGDDLPFSLDRLGERPVCSVMLMEPRLS